MAITWNSATGLVAEDTAVIRSKLAQQWKNAFNVSEGTPELNTEAETPAGPIIDGQAALISEKDAEIFLRYCVYGEKASEIATELNISDQALRMRISRMKKKILSNRALFSCLVALCLLSLR